MKIDQILMSVSDGVVIFNLFVEVFFRTHEHGYTKFLIHILFCKQTKSKWWRITNLKFFISILAVQLGISNVICMIPF
jgi:hypothetical protein